MPFTFDSGTQLFVAAHGRAVRALRFDRLSKSAIVVQNYVGHNEEVNDIVVAAHLLLSCSDEVLCHDFGTGRLKWRLLRPFGCRIAKLAVLGDVLVCCMEDCSVAFISIRRGAVSYYTELNGERKGGVPFIGIDPVNRMAYVNGNRCVNGWSLAVGRRVFNTDLVVGQIYSSASSIVYKILYGGAGDGAVRAYKIPTGETLWTALGHTENVNCLVASEYLELVISGSADGSLRSWDIRNGTPRWSTLIFPDKSGVIAAALAEWDHLIVVAGENGSLVGVNTVDGLQIWRTAPELMTLASVKIIPATNFSGIFERFNLGLMLLTEDVDGVVQVRDVKTGHLTWTWEGPMVYAGSMQSIVTTAAPTGGRACFGNIRTIIGLFDDGILRSVDAHTAGTLWRTSGGGGNALCSTLQNVNGAGFVSYGTDTGTVFTLDEMTGRRIWKISGFGDAVKHVHATKLFTVPPGSKRAVGQPVLLTWSADNVLRLWDQVTGERLWSHHDVDAQVAMCSVPGCPFIVCIGLYHVTSINFETGALVKLVQHVGDIECPIVHGVLNARLQSRSAGRATARSRKLTSRSSTYSASVHPIDESIDEEGKLIEIGTVDADGNIHSTADVPNLDLSNLPVSPKSSRGPSREATVACVLQSGDVFVINAQTGDISCAITFPWVEEGDGSMGHLLPKVHKPLVTLYEGIGVVGNGRKPLVIAALGDGESSFLASWRVFDDNRNVWELPVPSFGKTLFECIGNRLYYASVDRFTIYDPVNAHALWTFSPQREDMTSARLVLRTTNPRPQRRGGWSITNDEVIGVVFGSASGGMFALSTKNRESKIGDVVFLQLGASDEMTLNQDECPGHPSYHPPGSGGLSGLLRMRYDAAMWKTHRWVHTSASKWHEYAPKMLFFLEASLWLAMMFQLSYFPLRAQFPVLLNAWKSFSAKFVTFNISSMGGFDPFKPAYSTTVILVMSMIFVVTIQTWVMEWRLRNKESLLRAAVVGMLQLYARIWYLLLFVPMIRMIIAPFICNVAIQRVAYQIMQSQNRFLDAFAPKFFTATKPLPTAISMGRDMLCKGGGYFTFFGVSILLLLLFIPLVCRLIAVRGNITLLRHSSQFRSAIGWWRDDDSDAALDVIRGRNHGFALRSRFMAVILLVVYRTVLMALAQALLPPAAEFFFVLVTCGVMHLLLTIRPMFHDRLANTLLKSASAVIVLLATLAWFSSVWVRPIGPKGLARDGFINFLVVIGAPGVFICMVLEEQLRLKFSKLIRRCRSPGKLGGSVGGSRPGTSQSSRPGTSGGKSTTSADEQSLKQHTSREDAESRVSS